MKQCTARRLVLLFVTKYPTSKAYEQNSPIGSSPVLKGRRLRCRGYARFPNRLCCGRRRGGSQAGTRKTQNGRRSREAQSRREKRRRDGISQLVGCLGRWRDGGRRQRRVPAALRAASGRVRRC